MLSEPDTEGQVHKYLYEELKSVKLIAENGVIVTADGVGKQKGAKF